jgi:hypothetical protein
VTVQTLRVLGLSIASYLDALRHTVGGVMAMAVAVIALRHLIPGGDASHLGLLFTSVGGAASYLAYHLVFDRVMLRNVMGTLKFGGRASSAPPANVDTPVTTTV